MGENTTIEWCHHSFNPWIGAETMDRRQLHGSVIHWGKDAPRRRTSEANWRKPLAWDRAAARDGVRRRVFCASMADVFEDRRDLSGYRSALYDHALDGWCRTDIDVTMHASNGALGPRPKRTECLWSNVEPPSQMALDLAGAAV